MPISTSAIGSRIVREAGALSLRRCLSYAAALSPEQGPFLIDKEPGYPIILPTIIHALEWPTSMAARSYSTLDVTADELGRGVHHGQDTIFHKRLRLNDEIISEARIEDVRETSTGARTTVYIVHRDRNSVQLAESWIDHIYRDVDVAGVGRSDTTRPPWPAHQAPTQWRHTEIPISAGLPHIYSECARIWHPIHGETTRARAAGLPGIILHGSCTLGVIAARLIAGAVPGSLLSLRRIAAQFTGFVLPHCTLSLSYGFIDDEMLLFTARVGTRTVIDEGRLLFEPVGT